MAAQETAGIVKVWRGEWVSYPAGAHNQAPPGISPSCCQGAPSSTATPSRVSRYGAVR